MVQHHIEEVTQFGCDARVMHIEEDGREDLGTSFRAMVGVDLVQQHHHLLAEAQGAGVAGRRGALGAPRRADETQQGGESEPHRG